MLLAFLHLALVVCCMAVACLSHTLTDLKPMDSTEQSRDRRREEYDEEHMESDAESVYEERGKRPDYDHPMGPAQRHDSTQLDDGQAFLEDTQQEQRSVRFAPIYHPPSNTGNHRSPGKLIMPSGKVVILPTEQQRTRSPDGQASSSVRRTARETVALPPGSTRPRAATPGPSDREPILWSTQQSEGYGTMNASITKSWLREQSIRDDDDDDEDEDEGENGDTIVAEPTQVLDFPRYICVPGTSSDVESQTEADFDCREWLLPNEVSHGALWKGLGGVLIVFVLYLVFRPAGTVKT
ncbi:hypothetical protein BDY17DRAFT_310069 [Neohortaea acidophila]|uniref:Uncharacterized protein n=1 Tax=Neohortaea acidophila TaxID=245834 RepID=A0A6A6PTH6_9PEZI|nr:uncharacterized protein BDY17DRAFT_310069 [Neohortaea acidophila]KAF2482984.1 hypothetical protein BDY17DRAFT_310069 [Neohortaea acidophila]